MCIMLYIYIYACMRNLGRFRFGLVGLGYWILIMGWIGFTKLLESYLKKKEEEERGCCSCELLKLKRKKKKGQSKGS